MRLRHCYLRNRPCQSMQSLLTYNGRWRISKDIAFRLSSWNKFWKIQMDVRAIFEMWMIGLGVGRAWIIEFFDGSRVNRLFSISKNVRWIIIIIQCETNKNNIYDKSEGRFGIGFLYKKKNALQGQCGKFDCGIYDNKYWVRNTFIWFITVQIDIYFYDLNCYWSWNAFKKESAKNLFYMSC